MSLIEISVALIREHPICALIALGIMAEFALRFAMIMRKGKDL